MSAQGFSPGLIGQIVTCPERATEPWRAIFAGDALVCRSFGAAFQSSQPRAEALANISRSWRSADRSSPIGFASSITFPAGTFSLLRQPPMMKQILLCISAVRSKIFRCEFLQFP
jgi:hypothetical protein